MFVAVIAHRLSYHGFRVDADVGMRALLFHICTGIAKVYAVMQRPLC
jgi:hypothetical protein